MSYSLTKFVVHHFSETITVFQYVGVLPKWGMVFWLDFLFSFFHFLQAEKWKADKEPAINHSFSKL